VALLNHGGFGRVAAPVKLAQRTALARVEAEPNRFFSHTRGYEQLLVRECLADFLGVEVEDLALVPNATFALNTLAHTAISHGWSSVGTSLDYGNVVGMWDHLGIDAQGRHRRVYLDARRGDVTEQLCAGYVSAEMVMAPHVVSATTSALDLCQVGAWGEGGGAFVVADGAHGPGMLDLDISGAGVSAYAGDCHKWLGAPRGTGFLWVRRDLQRFIRWPIATESSADVSVSFGERTNWLGTSDPSAWMAIPAAIEFWRKELGPVRGGLVELAEYTSGELGDIGWVALATLKEVLMRSYVAPVGVDVASLVERLFEARLDVPVIEIDDMVIVRVSFAWYVSEGDIARLLRVLSGYRR
jgi:isopenicillin-N epimerase